MKKLILYIILICFLLAAILFGHHAIGEKGRIFIAMGDLRIQMSVVSAAIVLLFSSIVIMIVWWGIKRFFRMITGSRDWFGGLSRKKQQKAYFQAINACAIGDYDAAQIAIGKTFPGEFGGSNYILAADIDRKVNQGKKVENLLSIAETFPESEVSAKAQHAAWLMQQHQFTAAKAMLESIDEKARKQGVIVRLWLSVHAALGDWEEVKAKLSVSKKILGDDYVNWAQQAVQGEFSEIASKEGANALMQKWQDLPRAAKKDVANQIVYIQQLINQGLSKDAEPVLVELAKKSRNPAFYALFKQLNHPSPHQAMRLIESWIKADAENAKLYSVLAHMAYNSGDHELAEKAVRKALELASDPEDGRLLAILLEKQNAFERANNIYRSLLTS
ncbi:enzyme of heme biosynthesis [Glaciecola sp. MH2013]|uniref:heme biosynthesis HemY N-terminal domain-containing protein n=1 Tax=Glaciecola sp. MH2013 TaxID=2785524 RepID=UPI00189DD86F|nr:heme biosynthesis HemY N-terminal domain-containing protein [Glaciecola sp. MH2013]MBF7073515.1 enzyme of heme biosynthesis [Glaciecola sp. MH2013]